jgi:hypothetical protein
MNVIPESLSLRHLNILSICFSCKNEKRPISCRTSYRAFEFENQSRVDLIFL